jgi:hypothetical protein
MQLFSKLFIFLVFICCFQSCDIINPEEEIPSYIYIDTIRLVPNGTGNEGTLSHQFTDAWVYINDNMIGVFELPARIPILDAGTKNLKVAAGIKVDGLTSNRTDYKFVDFYTKDPFQLFRDSIINVYPVVSYYNDLNYSFKENFETLPLSIDSNFLSYSSIQLTSVPEEVFEGSYAGKISLTPTKPFFKGVTTDKLYLPKTAQPVFLEIDYKSSEDLLISVIAYINGYPNETAIVGITPKYNKNGIPIWNKIYVELTYELSAAYNINAEYFKIGFQSTLADEKSAATILLDNMKIIFAE